MIRINKLLRTVKIINKIPGRSGPGWDRPDVPPTKFVQQNIKFSHEDIIYTFFDSSMPQFFLTEPEIYEGGLIEGLPQLLSIWGVFIGTAFSIFLFHELVNPTRDHVIVEPTRASYMLNQLKRINEQKIAFKYAKQNPFGISINPQQYPNQNLGKYFYPKNYYLIKQALETGDKIRGQAQEYLKSAILRAKAPKESNHEGHH